MYTVAALGFIFVSLLCVGVIVYGLHRALVAASTPPAQHRRIVWGTIVVIACWIAGIGVAAAMGIFHDFSSFPPKMIAVALPPFFVLLFLTFRPSVTRLLPFVSPAWLVGIQSFRIAVEILLWLLFMQGLVPIQMTFEGYNFDVLTGLTALPVVYFIAKKRVPNVALVLWNSAGLVLLFTIVSIAFMSMPTPMRVFMNEPSNTIIAHFPFVWLPGVLVPVAYSMHFFSLRQLFLARRGKVG